MNLTEMLENTLRQTVPTDNDPNEGSLLIDKSSRDIVVGELGNRYNKVSFERTNQENIYLIKFSDKRN